MATYLNYWWPQLPLWAGIAVFGVALIVLNLTSVKSFGMLEFFLSSIKVISIVAFLLVGLCLIFFGLPGHAAVGTANLFNDGGFRRMAPVGVAVAGCCDVLLRWY